MALNSSCNDVATVASPSVFLTPLPLHHTPPPFPTAIICNARPLSTFENKMAACNNKP